MQPKCEHTGCQIQALVRHPLLERHFVFLPEFLQPWKVYAGPKPVPGLISYCGIPVL